MGTKITPYTQPEEESKKAQVARMFDNIAHSYDFLNHFFSLGIDVLWRKKAMRMLKTHLSTQQSADEVHLMDMATGTGLCEVRAEPARDWYQVAPSDAQLLVG